MSRPGVVPHDSLVLLKNSPVMSRSSPGGKASICNVSLVHASKQQV
jgi:hypothetical protein